VIDRLIDYSAEIDEGWVFRGHADANWQMLPQSFRPIGCFKRNWPFPIEGPLEQLNREADILITFAKLCDEVGIQIPMPQTFYETMTQWGNEIRLRFSNLNQDIDSRYLWESKYHEALAYGQHYGIPTRLLDFTKNPLYAAFFAINDRIEKHPSTFSSDMLCVWAVNLGLLKDNTLFSYKKLTRDTYKDGVPWQRFKTIRMPWARNTFLKQQEGIFIIDRGAEFIRAIEKSNYQSIENVVVNSDHKFVEPVLLKMELLANKDVIANAFVLLRRRNIIKAKLMPTLQNVASTMHIFDDIGINLYE
jgi:hypothetical protein